MTKITGILHDDQYMLLIISRCIVLRIGNVQTKLIDGIETRVFC